ncbi:hypothetical protein NAF19_02120 [Mucilaginibacter sp. RT5R15]|nr:hypothetical protein [Mucilaginibacter flavidus]
MRILEIDCPDVLKSTIRRTRNDSLINLCYPWGDSQTSYKTVEEWLTGDNENVKLDKYLIGKGISDNKHKQTIVLIAFKETLFKRPVNEDAIIKPYLDIELKGAKEDRIRYTTDSLRGFYIPKDLQDCFRKLNQFFDDTTKANIKKLSEREFASRYHRSFGMWLRNNWGLWGGSRLSQYFHELGIDFAEDMSGIIFDSYHRDLLGTQIKLAEQVKFYKDYWETARQRALKDKQEEFANYKLGDTVKYDYPYGYVSKKQEEDADKESCISKGIVVQKDSKNFFIKVKVITTCDIDGIISSDNKDWLTFNKVTKKWEKEKKRVIIKSKETAEVWFRYKDWKYNE